MIKLFQLILTAFAEEETLSVVFQKFFKGEIRKIGSSFNPRNLLKNNIPGWSIRNISNRSIMSRLNRRLTPTELRQLLDILKKKNEGESEQIDLFFNFEGKIKLSSSFLEYGIFEYNKDKQSGKLWLSIDGKEYSIGDTPTRIWLTMTQATGTNGSGAGSVLWDTLWFDKRTKTLKTGGVAESRENLNKRRQTTQLKSARAQRLINVKQKKANRPTRAKLASKAKRALKQRRP